MYVNVVFVIRYLYSAVSLTLVKEEHFIRIYYYFVYPIVLPVMTIQGRLQTVMTQSPNLRQCNLYVYLVTVFIASHVLM